MQLPKRPDGGVEIGISDILQWRLCPQRFEFGMRRHDEGGEAPESWSPANAYGSAVHLAVHLLDEGATEEEAVQAAVAKFRQWLGPVEVALLYHDLETYRSRDPQGVLTLVSEEDWSFPLFTHPVQGVVWFRFRLDRLYQRKDAPNRLIHLDYKTSKWIKTEKEVDEDLQLWGYNVGIHEVIADLYPELENVQLEQIYDQLKAGQVPTRKSDGQRRTMKAWMIAVIKAMIDDTELEPTYNEFCPWCDLKMDCKVVRDELTDFATAKIAALAPRNPKLKKDGTESKVLGRPELDPTRFGEYVALLPKVKRAGQVLKAFDEEVRKAIKDIPTEELASYVSSEAPQGYTPTQRTRKKFTAEGLRLAHEEMEDDFYAAASLSAEALNRLYGDEKDKVAVVLQHQVEGEGYVVVEPLK